MIIKSDWHIHSQYSYDATLSLKEIERNGNELGYEKFGVADHVNYNDESFLNDLKNSAENVKEFQKINPNMILGTELTPIEKPLFDYIKKHGTMDGYVAPHSDKPYEIELPRTKEELIAAGVQYAVGAAHWRIDIPNGISAPPEKDAMIKEWYRQMMWLACDERVTILGHPWGCGTPWYEDFSIIPRSMNMDLAHALLENKKYVECNGYLLFSPYAPFVSEKFRVQYAEFIRELFEMGVPVTYGSDAHYLYVNEGKPHEVDKLLRSVGFKEGDLSELKDEDLWRK